ncbi:hypothetical protein F4803DRAFT_539116 [Xylaria telfairii]|nr:hypothetical protein F4803DRAFT_539116 [Xylaria telfairii]
MILWFTTLSTSHSISARLLRLSPDLLLDNPPSLVVESIKLTALSCRRLLEDCLGKIRKFEHLLGPWAEEKGIRSTVDKIRFAFWLEGRYREVAQLSSRPRRKY